MATTQSMKKRAGGNYLAFSAKYAFSPDVKLVDLATDAGCILGPAIATANLLAIQLGDGTGDLGANPKEAGKMLWGLMYQLKAVAALVEEIEVRS